MKKWMLSAGVVSMMVALPMIGFAEGEEEADTTATLTVEKNYLGEGLVRFGEGASTSGKMIFEPLNLAIESGEVTKKESEETASTIKLIDERKGYDPNRKEATVTASISDPGTDIKSMLDVGMAIMVTPSTTNAEDITWQGETINLNDNGTNVFGLPYKESSNTTKDVVLNPTLLIPNTGELEEATYGATITWTITQERP